VAVVGSLANGCADTGITSLQVHPPPVANAGPDLYIFAGDSATLQGSVSATGRYYWQPPAFLNDPQSLQPRASPGSSQVYTLFAESANGCGTTSDAMQVYVYEAVEIPNVFSPNGDGINDTWQIRALASYPDCRVQVFDRYGRLLLSQTNYNTPWDGRYRNQPLPAGVYYYVIDLRVANRLLKGSVTLLR
jgi:gliding motility-associated-like protein